MSDYFHATTVTTFGLIQISCEHGNLTFACHDASCRPPTSGGTGGSRAAGSSSKSSAVSYKQTEFGRKIQAAIAAEPALAGRKNFAGLVAENEKARMEHSVRAKAEVERKLRLGIIDINVNPRSNWGPESQKVRHQLEAELKAQINAKAHHKFIDDPNARAEGPVETLLRNYVRKRMDGDPSSIAVEHGEMTLLVDGSPVVFSVGMSNRGVPLPRKTLKGIDDEMITPEFEAASTRVGHLINDEIKERKVAKVKKAEDAFDAFAADLKDMGLEPDHITVWRRPGQPPTVQARGSIQLSDSTKERVVAALVRHGVETQSRDIHLTNAKRKAQEETYDEVMSEILPMGGKIAGTPAHRAGKGMFSTNEQVTRAVTKYPTSWVDASNFRGPVEFKTGKGRGHYVDGEAKILLNGTVSVAVHELGHRMEATVPGLRALEEHFYTRRTEERNEAGFLLRQPTPVPLSKLVPGSGYGKDEKAIEDNFFESYAGKRYPDAFELTTVGMEAITMGKTGHNSKGSGNTIDDDHAAFIFGALVTLVPS